MAMTQTSPDQARSRYNQAFTSSIFDGPPDQKSPGFVPAGKRRDQTTAEMFGSYAEKDLRGMPKTFVPKEDPVTARRKKQQFLSSEVLPCSGYPTPAPEAREAKGYSGYPEVEDEEAKVDTGMVRQMHLTSNMFGRSTPGVSAEHVHDRSNRLLPNDFVWHSHPEPVLAPADGRDTRSHADRAYEQKCSTVFDYHSPEVRNMHASQRIQDKREEQDGDLKRRANVYYSDLFGRSAAYDGPEQVMQSARRPKTRGSNEDQMIVHQDWTDARTELLQGSGQRPEAPHLRKGEELHKARIFGETARGDWQYPARIDAVTQDNSEKIRPRSGMTTQDMHQAHLRTSTESSEFYENAMSTRDWEVIELHVSGLPFDADDEKVRSLCQGFDLQIVRCKADIDPVRNLCKGRAKITVRYNPIRDSIEGLIQHLEAAKLKVET
eukprot:gb/GFBE01020620.1/.p1 GENE.gb/GFBE01020620.1/~~gb/GFBE01020620.1/.p1  ORF type:complete len:435 (+),score=87.75 gb/GFBE01020620.1/:1-1305(+)